MVKGAQILDSRERVWRDVVERKTEWVSRDLEVIDDTHIYRGPVSDITLETAHRQQTVIVSLAWCAERELDNKIWRPSRCRVFRFPLSPGEYDDEPMRINADGYMRLIGWSRSYGRFLGPNDNLEQPT